MKTFLRALKGNKRTTRSCAPCLTQEDGCYEGEFYAEYSDSEFVILWIGPPPPEQGTCFISGSGSAKSCISYLDALNKAKMATMKVMLAQLKMCGGYEFSGMVADGYPNSEISVLKYCPCGWTGGPVEEIEPADMHAGYLPAQANWKAWDSLNPYDPSDYPDSCLPPV